MTLHGVLGIAGYKVERNRLWAFNFGLLLFVFVASVGLAHATAPKITALSANSDPVGASVTISGTSFGATRGSSTVKVNGTLVTSYVSWSDTSIQVKVPAGANTSGNIVVTVGGVASNGWAFTVIPSITSLSLASGPQKMGFDINGYTFGSTQGQSTVKIGSTPLTVLAGGWSSTKIAVQIPAGATTGSIVVTVANNASNSKTFTVQTFGCN